MNREDPDEPTLLDVLEAWTVRYGLDEVDRTNLSLAVGWAVRRERRFPPVPSELAVKLGGRTWSAITERFLLERFGWNDATEAERSPAPARRVAVREVEGPPAPARSAAAAPYSGPPAGAGFGAEPRREKEPRVAKRYAYRKVHQALPPLGRDPVTGRVLRRCSICHEPGHRRETCARRSSPAPSALTSEVLQ